MPNGFRMEGAEQLGTLSKELKALGDKKLQASMRKKLRLVVLPVVEEVRFVAQPISAAVAATIGSRFSYSPRGASVAIRADRNKMPRGHEQLPQLLEFGSDRSGGRFIRHPVFGKDAWVNQPITPFFYKTIKKETPKVEAAMLAVLIEVETELKGRT